MPVQPFVLALLVLTAPLAACTGHPPPAATVTYGSPDRILPALSDTCGLAAAAPVVGQDFAELARLTLPGGLRLIRPGQKVGDDLSPSRLNARIGSDGVVRGLFCG